MPKIKPKKELTEKDFIGNEIEKYSDLEALTNSDGGQLLIKGLEKDFMSIIHTLRSKYMTAELKDLLPLLAKLDIQLDLIEVLKGAAKAKNAEIEILKEILKKEAERLEEE